MDTIASGESRVPMNHKAILKALSSRPRNAMSLLDSQNLDLIFCQPIKFVHQLVDLPISDLDLTLE